jgi:hypothetical protein
VNLLFYITLDYRLLATPRLARQISTKPQFVILCTLFTIGKFSHHELLTVRYRRGKRN